MRHFILVILLLFLTLSGGGQAFSTNTRCRRHHHGMPPTTHMRQQQQQQRYMVALTPPEFDVTTTTTQSTKVRTTTTPSSSSPATSFYWTKEECRPLIRLGRTESEKVINLFGLWCLFVSLVTFPIWIVAMTIVSTIVARRRGSWDPHGALFDTTGKLWAKVWLTGTNSYPTISGSPIAKTGACLYVANHASWLDIPILCTVLDPVFKFIAKGELRHVPGIGQQLHGGNHILIDRDDRKSQLRTFKEAIAWLQKGVPIMAFPEGMRSRDGRLMEFKKGLFSLAVKAQVPIVPITLCHTHAIMPTYSFFPVQSGAGKVHVHVGAAIDPTGKTEAELEVLVRNEFLAHLPADQLPRPITANENEMMGEPIVIMEAERATISSD